MCIQTRQYGLGLQFKFREMHSVSRLLSDMCMSLSHHPLLIPIPTCLINADNYAPGTLPDADLNYIKEVMSFVKDLS